jgi:hypothetical protein
MFLPPYSPDLNPIELMFSNLETLLRKAAERTADALRNRLGELLDHFTPQECANLLRHVAPVAINSLGSISSGDRLDPAVGEIDANPAAHDLEQDFNATRIVQAIEDPQCLRKWSGHEAYPLTLLERTDKLHSPILIGRLDQSLHDPLRHRNRPAVRHEQVRDAHRAIDAAPAIALEVQHNKQITWEYRRSDGTQLARMTHRFQIPWEERTKPLPTEIRLRDRLTLR